MAEAAMKYSLMAESMTVSSMRLTTSQLIYFHELCCEGHGERWRAFDIHNVGTGRLILPAAKSASRHWFCSEANEAPGRLRRGGKGLGMERRSCLCMSVSVGLALACSRLVGVHSVEILVQAAIDTLEVEKQGIERNSAWIQGHM